MPKYCEGCSEMFDPTERDEEFCSWECQEAFCNTDDDTEEN